MVVRPVSSFFNTSSQPFLGLDIVNGETNPLVLNIENKSDKNVTLLSVAGEFRNPDTDKVIKPVSSPSPFLCCLIYSVDPSVLTYCVYRPTISHMACSSLKVPSLSCLTLSTASEALIFSVGKYTYRFYVHRFKPGDVKLSLWLEHLADVRLHFFPIGVVVPHVHCVTTGQQVSCPGLRFHRQCRGA